MFLSWPNESVHSTSYLLDLATRFTYCMVAHRDANKNWPGRPFSGAGVRKVQLPASVPRSLYQRLGVGASSPFVVHRLPQLTGNSWKSREE